MPASSPTRLEPGLVARARRQAEVAVRARAGARRRVSLGEAEEVRKPAGAGVDVDRAGEHAGVVVEDLLGAVAVVGVDVDHGDRRAERVANSAAAAAAALLR